MSSSSKMKGKRLLPFKSCRGKSRKIGENKICTRAKYQAAFVVESAEGSPINYKMDARFRVLCVVRGHSRVLRERFHCTRLVQK